VKTDFLIIGSGIAGLNFALKASKFGTVTIVTKKRIMESNTNLAQGGIAAAMSEDDTFRMHIEDTLRAGCGLSNRHAVEILVENGPEEIQSLISYGAKFDTENDELQLSREAGHSKFRIVHSGDTTGREIERVLTKRVRENRDIEVLENCFAVDIIVKGSRCYGASVLDVKNKEIVNIFSRGTILATGGVGYVYQNTTNPEIATGDGIAMAFRGGAKVEDMEFVQFHPTTLNKIGAPHFLISETFRGEGAVLVNEKGERFMEKYDAMGELAPRDIVSRATFNELKKGAVYLDIRHKGKSFILKRFPMINKKCLKYGIDITKDLIPVSPAAHYICGGIKTNEYGETSIQNLLAFGECACTGVHGANRLASNSLLESVVFSSLGALKAKDLLKNEVAESKLSKEVKFYNMNGQKLENLKADLRKAMWDYVGIIRNEENLKLMLKKLSQFEKRINELNENGKRTNVHFLELKNMLTVSKLITQAAYVRKESRGTHYREDYPKTNNKNWLKHIYLERKRKGMNASFV
jgi:L-aspartate oxidase